MYICSQSGELVHPIHLQHLVDDEPSNEQGHTQGLERGQPAHTG